MRPLQSRSFLRVFQPCFHPQVATYRLDALPAAVATKAPMLLLASDGVWDLWTFDEAARYVHIYTTPLVTDRPSAQGLARGRSAKSARRQGLL